MEIDLSNKKAFVTASSKGIGFGVASVLSRAGAETIILSRSETNLQKACKKIKEESGRKPEYIVADLSNKLDLTKTISNIEKMGMPDIFFFCTGGPSSGKFMEKTMDEWEDATSLLLYPAVYLCRELIPAMKNRGWGRIIISTSVAIKEPLPDIALSNVVRISSAGLVRTLSTEVGEHGITVNGIMPGIIETDRIKKLTEERAKREGITEEDALKGYIAPIPSGRLGKPEEIGYLSAFLCSEYASYINGSMIPVDGGRLSSVF